MTQPPNPQVPPGWYPHPTMVGTQQYWDGSAWTDHVAPLAPAAPAPVPAVVVAAPAPQPSGGIVCPHCQTVGKVKSRRVKQKAGVSGGKATGAVLTGGLSLLATGLSRKQQVTELRCGKCKMVWHVA